MTAVSPTSDKRETHRLIASDKVEGTDVRRTDGDKIGAIKRVMIEKQDGKVEFAVMRFGGILGIGERYCALPWGVLRYDPRLDAYEVNLSDEQLKNIPAIDETDLDTFQGSEREREITAYFGPGPFWF